MEALSASNRGVAFLTKDGFLTHHYRLYDVPFGSDVPLALPAVEAGVAASFDLRSAGACNVPGGTGMVDHVIVDGWMTSRAFASGELEIEWKDWLTLWISPDGSDIQYRVQESTYPRAFEAYVANFAISAALLLQGEETLHSTVVQFDGKGIGLLGGSGAGKSTLAAHLLGLGGELVTDDMLRITETGGAVYAEPGQPRIKLFEETARRHYPAGLNRGQWNPVSEKYLFDTDDLTKPRERRRLDALLWLTEPIEGQPDAVTCERLAGLELFQVLTGSTMNSKLQTPDRLARQLRYTQWVARKLPVYALRYPRRHDIFPEVVAAIRALQLAAV